MSKKQHQKITQVQETNSKNLNKHQRNSGTNPEVDQSQSLCKPIIGKKFKKVVLYMNVLLCYCVIFLGHFLRCYFPLCYLDVTPHFSTILMNRF